MTCFLLFPNNTVVFKQANKTACCRKKKKKSKSISPVTYCMGKSSASDLVSFQNNTRYVDNWTASPASECQSCHSAGVFAQEAIGVKRLPTEVGRTVRVIEAPEAVRSHSDKTSGPAVRLQSWKCRTQEWKQDEAYTHTHTRALHSDIRCRTSSLPSSLQRLMLLISHPAPKPLIKYREKPAGSG